MDPVRFASKVVIDRFVKSEGLPPTELQFNTSMICLDMMIRREFGIDIHLPRCWSEHGEGVVWECLPYLSRCCDSSGEVRVTFTERLNETEEGPEMVFISSVADACVGIPMDAEPFADAPFEFQRRFSDLMGEFTSSGSDLASGDTLRRLYERAIGAFSHGDFPLLGHRAAMFDADFRAALGNRNPGVKLLEMSELFWSWFCAHLRLHEGCSWNVPDAVIEGWIEAIPYEDRNLEIKLQNYAWRVSGGRSDDPLISGMLAEREARVSTIRGLLREMAADEAGDSHAEGIRRRELQGVQEPCRDGSLSDQGLHVPL